MHSVSQKLKEKRERSKGGHLIVGASPKHREDTFKSVFGGEKKRVVVAEERGFTIIKKSD